MSDSLFDVEYHPGGEIVFRLKPFKLRGLPEPTKQHLLSAKKEMLLALRSLLDRAVATSEEPEQSPEGKTTRIEVQ